MRSVNPDSGIWLNLHDHKPVFNTEAILNKLITESACFKSDDRFAYQIITQNEIVMKTLKYYVIAIVALIAGAQLLTACTGYVVATGPPMPPDEVVVVAPSPQYVWVPGYYSYRGGNYIWIQGSYQIPPRGRNKYVQGEWMKTPKGYKHGRGHWK